MPFIILSTIQKTQPDDRSFETGVINSSQIEVFTGKYLLYFYNFNNNQKPLSGSCLTLSLPTKCCYSISLLKNYWSFFIDITKNHPYSGGRAGERRACWDQRGQTRERGPHSSHKAALIQNLNQSQSGLDWSTRPKNITQNSQKSFYSIHKLLNMISLQSETWIKTPKS